MRFLGAIGIFLFAFLGTYLRGAAVALVFGICLAFTFSFFTSSRFAGVVGSIVTMIGIMGAAAIIFLAAHFVIYTFFGGGIIPRSSRFGVFGDEIYVLRWVGGSYLGILTLCTFLIVSQGGWLSTTGCSEVPLGNPWAIVLDIAAKGALFDFLEAGNWSVAHYSPASWEVGIALGFLRLGYGIAAGGIFKASFIMASRYYRAGES